MNNTDFAPELAALLKFSGDVGGAIRMYSNYNPQAQHGYIHEERRDPSLFGADLMHLSGAITQMLEVGVAVQLGEPTHIAKIARAVARMFASEYAAPGHEAAKTFAFWTRLLNLPAAIEALESLANKAEWRAARPVPLATAHVEPKPLFMGTWHHGQGNLCCGTVRYMRADFDTQPAPEVRTAIFDWVCSTMNAALARWREQEPSRSDEEAVDAAVRPVVASPRPFATPQDGGFRPSDFVPIDQPAGGQANVASSPAKRSCGDCGAAVGALHAPGCDVELCADCGEQAIGCSCERRVRPRLAWTGYWPGEVECREFGWWARFVPGSGWVRCAPTDVGAGPDLNRLHVDATWDAAAGRFVRRS
jgi:hypothetical protein